MRGHYYLRLLALLMFTTLGSLAWSQAVVSCNSDDMHYHACDIGPNHGVTLVRQHSDAKCIQGQTYGVRGNQVWVDRGCRADFQAISQGGWNNNWNQGSGGSVVTCSSDDMHRHYCSIPDHSRVRVARQHSDAQCIEGQTYGVRGNQLWVDRGCRADFEVVAGGHHGWEHDHDGDHDHDRDHDRDHDWDNGSSSPHTVTCSSDDMHRHTCDVGSNNGIRFVRQRSDARCELNRTYGFHGNQIWVDRGCRADFEVTASGRRPPRP